MSPWTRERVLRLVALWIALLTILQVLLGPAGSPELGATAWNRQADTSRLEAKALAADQALTRHLATGERHRYRFTPDSTAPWLITIEQRGVGVLATLIDDQGQVQEFDSPLQYYGTDQILIESPQIRQWALEVVAPNGSGEYVIQRRSLAAAKPRGLEIEHLLSQAQQLYADVDKESKKQALTRIRGLLDSPEPFEDLARRAELLDFAGTLERHVGELQRALEDHSSALEVWIQLEDPQRQARSSNGLGLARWNLGQSAPARDFFETALKLRLDQGDLAGAVRTSNNICLTYHSEGLLAKAGECYREALELVKEHGELPRNEGLLRLNLSYVYHSLAEPNLAQENAVRALELLRQVGDQSHQADAQNLAAVLARSSGRYSEALRYYFQALDTERRGGTLRKQGRILNNIGFAYYSLGDLDRAESFFRQALPLRRQSQDQRGEAITLGHLGSVYRKSGDIESAMLHHRQSLELNRKQGNKRGEATSLLHLAESQTAHGDVDAALTSIAAGLEVLTSVGARDTEANLRLRRANLLLSRDSLDGAREDIDQALRLSRAMRFPVGEITAHVLLARWQRQQGDQILARQETDAALRLIENLRTRVSHPDHKASFLASVREAYELRLDLEMDLHRMHPDAGHDRRALEISERARARSLLDLVQEETETVTSSAADVSQDLRGRYEAARRRLNAKADRQMRLLRKEHDAAEAAALEVEIAAAMGELEHLEAQLTTTGRDALTVSRPSAIDSDHMMALLDDGTVMLEYALGEQRSFVWRIERDRIRVTTLPGRSEIEARVQRVQEILSNLRSGSRQQDLAAVRDLSRLLLAPILHDPLLQESTPITASSGAAPRLVIVPDGALSYLPFAALHLPRPGSATQDDPWQLTQPLLERFEITHLPSASVLAALRHSASQRAQPSRQVAVLADPVYDRRDARLPTPQDDRTSAQESASDPGVEAPIPFVRLGATRQEAEAIMAAADPQRSWAALGFAANRQTVFDPQLAEFRFVHFATHGWVDARNPSLSGLVLSQLDPSGQFQPGLLRLHDISHLPLNADLVVLSGCQTAVGKEIRGEGPLGLGRGFMSAGAQRVAASLWRVQDRATADLMAHFYDRLLNDGMTPSASLRAAQLSIRQQRRWRQPYYWAAFVMQGDWRYESTTPKAMGG